MKPDEVILLLILATLALTAGVVGYGVALHRERKRHERTRWRLEELEAKDRSLEALQASVDRVAINVAAIAQIERLAIEQLAARETAADVLLRPPAAPRAVTPH